MTPACKPSCPRCGTALPIKAYTCPICTLHFDGNYNPVYDHGASSSKGMVAENERQQVRNLQDYVERYGIEFRHPDYQLDGWDEAPEYCRRRKGE